MILVPGTRVTFETPYDQYRDRDQQEATVVGMVPRESYDYDECGDLYRIRFDDGAVIEAWPEEIDTAAMTWKVTA